MHRRRSGIVFYAALQGCWVVLSSLQTSVQKIRACDEWLGRHERNLKVQLYQIINQSRFVTWLVCLERRIAGTCAPPCD